MYKAMRFAGEAFNKYTGDSDVSEYGAAWQKSHQMMQQKPVVPGFNTEDLKETPELPAGHPFNQHQKGNYILNNPGSGISSVEGQQVALAPAVVAGIGAISKGLKAYGAFRVGQAALDGGRVNPGTTADYAGQDPTAAPGSTSSSKQRAGGGLGRVISDMSDGKKESMRGPTLRSPYHQ